MYFGMLLKGFKKENDLIKKNQLLTVKFEKKYPLFLYIYLVKKKKKL